MKPSILANELDVSRTQISREIAKLEEENYVNRSEMEGKHRTVELTKESLEIWSSFNQFISQ